MLSFLTLKHTVNTLTNDALTYQQCSLVITVRLKPLTLHVKTGAVGVNQNV